MIPVGSRRAVMRRSCAAQRPAMRTRVAASKRQYYTAVADYRRMRDRRTLVPTVHEDNPVWVMFPRERLGLSYDLNWHLNLEHKITPTKDAFRNVHLRQLMMYSQGTADKAKAINYTPVGTEPLKVYYTEAQLNPRFVNGGNAPTVDGTVFRRVGRIIADQIGQSDQIFMEDAVAGAHRLAEAKVRILTNSANVNLFARHALPRTPLPHVRNFDFDVQVYIAPNFAQSPKSAEFSGLGNSFAIVNLDRKMVLVGGTNYTKSIRTALSSFLANRMLLDDFPMLVMNAHLVSTEAGKSAFIVDPMNIMNDPSLAKNINGYDGLVWNNYGSFRLFDSLTHNNAQAPRQRGNIVEKVGNSVQITQPLESRALEAEHPSAIVFLVQDAKLPEVGQFQNVAAATKFFATGGNSKQPFFLPFDLLQPQQYADLFAQLAQTHKTPIYVINTKRKDGKELKSEQVYSLVNDAISGALSKTAAKL